MRRPLCAVACIALVALSVPAESSAEDALQVYQRLALRRLSPAPLVPTSVPPSMGPLERTMTTFPSRRRSGYGLRMVHYAAEGPDAVIVLEGRAFRTMGAALRDGRRLGFRARRTRVRGHPGYLLSRHLGPTQRSLVWVEDGVVYTLGTGTPRKVSLAQLRATAAGLEHLERDYMGTPPDPDSFSEGHAVTTEHAVSTLAVWEAQCVAPDGSPAGSRVGSARVTMLSHSGNAFAFDIAQHRVGTDAWSGSVSGTISPGALTLSIRATGTFDGLLCDTGALSFALDRRSDGTT